jgi:hypothetical protein
VKIDSNENWTLLHMQYRGFVRKYKHVFIYKDSSGRNGRYVNFLHKINNNKKLLDIKGIVSQDLHICFRYHTIDIKFLPHGGICLLYKFRDSA